MDIFYSNVHRRFLIDYNLFSPATVSSVYCLTNAELSAEKKWRLQSIIIIVDGEEKY
jgi:hypothetical protein